MALGGGTLLGSGLGARRDKDHRQVGTRISRQPMQIETIDEWHSDIGDQAIDFEQDTILEKRLSGGE